jgi:membrane-associated phospholipid phosphatase
LAGILLPLLMLVTVVATANHFILDAIAGAVVAGLSYGLALLFDKKIRRCIISTISYKFLKSNRGDILND